MSTVIDRLFENVMKNGYVCLGLDTSPNYLPESLLRQYPDVSEAVLEFNKKIIDATYDSVACYKVQIAYYEAMGIKGLCAYKKTLEYIKAVGQIAVADIKRGDIKDTAAMYAKAHFEGDFEADMITLNPYMGIDTLEPYEEYFAKGKGCFVLMRTSNQGARDIQYLNTDENKRIYEIVGEKIRDFGRKYMGTCGYSSVGAVMGATNVEEGKKLRAMLDTTFLLIPGFGAQGGTAADVALYLTRNNGGIVNSSRAILTNYKKYEDGSGKFDYYARKEALEMNTKIKAALLNN